MGAVHKISANFYEESFNLVALHCSLQDYAITYGINQHLKSNFKRSSKDLEIPTLGTFSYFEWKDEINDRYWTLISNASFKEAHLAGIDLFSDEPSYRSHHLIPEHKEVDFLLKMEMDDFLDVEDIVKKLYNIPKMSMVYELDIQKLKSKNNLIF